jgi:hypothetical protein
LRECGGTSDNGIAGYGYDYQRLKGSVARSKLSCQVSFRVGRRAHTHNCR